jgi:xylose isomerase
MEHIPAMTGPTPTTGLKNSVGIWAFGPNATRFLPAGYHQEAVHEDMVAHTHRVVAHTHRVVAHTHRVVARTHRVVEGLADVVDGLEYHYPGEINEDSVDAITSALGPLDTYCLAAGLHSDPTYKLGTFINPDPELRRQGIETLKRGVDLAAWLDAHFIIWPGAEGYNYNFQREYIQAVLG